MIPDQERIDCWLALARELDQIGLNPAVRSQLPEARERLNIGMAGLSVVAPRFTTREGLDFQAIFCYKPEAFNHSLKIYPFVNEDLALGWSGFATTGLATGNSYAEYWRPMNQVSFCAKPKETLRALACMFIHELGHVLAAKKNGHANSYFISPLSERIDEEVAMRNFDCKLLLALGGPAYRQECDRGIYWIGKNRKKKCNKQPENWLDFFAGKGAVYSSFLGPPPTAQVASERDALLRLHCDFMAADQNLNSVGAMNFKRKIIQEYAINLHD